MTTMNADPQGTPDLIPLMTDVSGVARLISRSERSVFRDDSAGRIPKPIKIGGSKRWRIAEIREWIAAGCPNRRDWESRRRGLEPRSPASAR